MKGMLFTEPRTATYSHEEITARLETKFDQRVSFILSNWQKLNANQMADHLGINRTTVFKLVKGKVPKKRHVKLKPSPNNKRKVVDLETGIYYDTIVQLCKAIDKPESTVWTYLAGKRKITRFQYA